MSELKMKTNASMTPVTTQTQGWNDDCRALRPPRHLGKGIAVSISTFVTVLEPFRNAFETVPFPSPEDAAVAALVMKTNMSKTDANLVLKMLRSPGFDLSKLKCKNVNSLHQIIDGLIEIVRGVFECF
jgi:hypothetical protein